MKTSYFFLVALSLLFLTSCEVQHKKLFVGTYTDGDSEGIYSFDFNTSTGELMNKSLAAKIESPSFLKIAPNKKYLYSVQEGENPAIVAFEINGEKLEKINEDNSVGASSCHIGISNDGKHLAVSAYTGGSISVFELEESGELSFNPQHINHNILDSIKKSHAHASKFTNDGLFTADLGLDAVKRYVYNGNQYVAAEQHSMNLPDKAGPRHFTFSKGNQFMYVINELNSSITVFERDVNGFYNELETKSTLPEGFDGQNNCADIHLSDDGKFLYGSNRGENTIVIFRVNKETGKLTLVGRQSVKGNWPRNFAIDPTNKFLLVANKKSSNITIFSRNQTTGELSFLHDVKLPNPVCLEFL